MRLTFPLFFLLFFASVCASPQAKPEYNVTVHVSASRMVLHGDSAAHYQYLSATIDGKKVEKERPVVLRRKEQKLSAIFGVHSVVDVPKARSFTT